MSEINLFQELCVTVLDEREAAEPITFSQTVDLTPAERKLRDIADWTTIDRVLKKMGAEREKLKHEIKESNCKADLTDRR